MHTLSPHARSEIFKAEFLENAGGQQNCTVKDLEEFFQEKDPSCDVKNIVITTNRVLNFS